MMEKSQKYTINVAKLTNIFVGRFLNIISLVKGEYIDVKSPVTRKVFIRVARSSETDIE